MDGFRGLGASRPIQFSPSYSSDRTIYGFSGTELFKSEDGGNNWAAINIPTPDYNFITNSYLAYHNFKRSSKRIFIAALIAALLSYLFIGYLRLEKNCP